MEQKTKTRKKAVLDVDSLMYGKVPPQANELETAVLGAIMLEKNALDSVMEILKPESFYTDAHQKIFKAMISLASKNMPVDLLTVVQELKARGDLDAVGGPFFITKLTNFVVSSANIEAHARIVKQKFIQRELIRIGGEMLTDAYEDSTDVFDMLDNADAKISSLQGDQKSGYTHVSQELAARIQRLEALRMNESHITGVPSGFNDLDKITHGWQDTDLIVLAARPSVGKTAFSLNLARNAAVEFLSDHRINNTPLKSVVFFSLEMSKGQLVDRLLSAESEIWLEKICTGRLSDHEMKTLYKKGVLVINEMPIFIDDTAAMNVFEMRAKARRLKNKHNAGLIIIDYLQLMSGTGDNKNGNREQEISKISRDLKALAKELKVPIIALSQLSRKVEDRKGEKMPQLSDLRESGAIEQDADMVMFLYRPEYYEITSNEMGESNKGETHVKIAKHRNGSLDTVKLNALLHIQKFTDWTGSDIGKQSTTWRPVESVGNRKDIFD